METNDNLTFKKDIKINPPPPRHILETHINILIFEAGAQTKCPPSRCNLWLQWLVPLMIFDSR